MKDEDKTKEQLIDELAGLRQRITELEKSETELGKTRAMFQGLFECAPDAIVVVNSEGRIVEANTQAEKIFGYSKNELLDKPVEVLIPERFRKRHYEHMRSYMSKPRIRFMGSELELYGLRKDGIEFPVDIALGPLETKDGIMVLSIVRDITEHMRMEEALRTSEAKYRSIFENAVEGIFQTSIEGGILAANPALAHMLGYESQEEIITSITNARKLYVEPGRRLQLVRTIRARGIVTNFEAQIRRKDGSK
ncbi:MAG: PAS domain S-box protein, partial [Candidatus Methanoperedens sp.]|nr:PAS domain S-box protein [Candidatus Methanoperedens sp.]